jgi:MYXO-CTERM domain-containing protein
VFWQYSATGTVPGIAGSNNVDEDRFFGSAGDLATWNANTIERDAGVDAPPAEAGAGTDGGPDGDAGMDLAKGSGCGCASTGGDAPGGLLLAAFVIVGVRRRPRA